jgi:hypothetical protein
MLDFFLIDQRMPLSHSNPPETNHVSTPVDTLNSTREIPQLLVIFDQKYGLLPIRIQT